MSELKSNHSRRQHKKYKSRFLEGLFQILEVRLNSWLLRVLSYLNIVSWVRQDNQLEPSRNPSSDLSSWLVRQDSYSSILQALKPCFFH